MKLYEVKDWERNYTVAQNRNCSDAKPLPWVAMRTKHDGKGYRRVMKRRDCMALMGAWMLIVEVAAKCPKHGLLHDGDFPINAADLADKTGGDEKVFATALEVFSSQEIAWLTARALERSPTPLDNIQVTVRNDTVRNDSMRAAESDEPNGFPRMGDSAFDRFWKAYPRRDGRIVGKKATRALFAKLSEEDSELAIKAAAFYAQTTKAKEGYAKDPERFLKSDYWRDYLEPQLLEKPSRVLTPEEYHLWNPSTGLGS